MEPICGPANLLPLSNPLMQTVDVRGTSVSFSRERPGDVATHRLRLFLVWLYPALETPTYRLYDQGERSIGVTY